MAIFNIYYVFAPFVKLCGSRFLHFFSLCDVRNEAVFLLLELSSLREIKQKKTRKNMEFWHLNSYYKRSDWKIWLAERVSQALTSKLWNKKKCMLPNLTEIERNLIMLTLYGFILNLLQNHLRDSHVKFTGKNKVGNTTWSKLHGLIGQKTTKQFSVNSRGKFSCQYQVSGKPALGL